MQAVIGIDLGTTNTCMAVMRHGKVEIIANEQGNRVTPSYVAFDDFQCFIGDVAKHQMSLNQESTVYDAKRMIGRQFDDPVIQSDMKKWPFTVKCVDQEARIEVMFKGERKLFAAEVISAKILSRMKEIAEEYLNEEVRGAVITVPAYFNNAQRQATIDAGEIAGLKVLSIINEPTAAAIAYRYVNDDHLEDNTKVLVFDLGGGTFDVSVLNIIGEQITVLATNGDTHLGGGDFDCTLVDHFVQEIKKKHKIDIGNDKRTIARLRMASEKAKRYLSTVSSTSVIVDALHDGITFSTNISRAKFEDLNAQRFRETLKPVQQALNDAKLSKNDIEHVVLVGGSTRIPKIRKMLQDFFDGKNPDITINPDEAVAIGAAVHAAVVGGDPSGKVFGKLLQDVTPLSLGLDVYVPYTDAHVTNIVIPKNSRIPISKSIETETRIDNQKSGLFTIRQGESTVPDLNVKLGEFKVNDLPPGPAGTIFVNTVFDININGILIVTATENSTGKSQSLKIENVVDHARKERLAKMIDEETKCRMEVKNRRLSEVAKTKLEEECYAMKNASAGNDDDRARKIVVKCDEILEWMEGERETHEVYKNRLAELKSLHPSP